METMTNPVGIVSDIQHCSVHDGPGIRTTIFLKGCNMRCQWCHNPETIFPKPETLINESNCIQCGKCESGCFSDARIPCGREMSVADVWEDIACDLPYYGENGGITISGGEPILQHDFVKALLLTCKEKGVGTAIESNLSLSRDKVLEVCSLCDTIMCDIKAFDTTRHQQYTGVGNKTILENLKSVCGLGKPIIVRTPIIKGVNDTEQEIRKIAAFLSSLENIRYYELLTYHPLGLSKNRSTHFTPCIFEKRDKQTMKVLAMIAKSYHLPVRIDNIIFE